MGWGRGVQALRMAAVVSDAKTGWDRHLKTLENPRMNESGMSRVSRTKQHKQGTAHAPAAPVPRWRPPMQTKRRGKTRRLLGARSVISTGMCVEMQASTASVNCRVGSLVLKFLSRDASRCPGGIKGIEGSHEINCGPGSKRGKDMHGRRPGSGGQTPMQLGRGYCTEHKHKGPGWLGNYPPKRQFGIKGVESSRHPGRPLTKPLAAGTAPGSQHGPAQLLTRTSHRTTGRCVPWRPRPGRCSAVSPYQLLIRSELHPQVLLLEGVVAEGLDPHAVGGGELKLQERTKNGRVGGRG